MKSQSAFTKKDVIVLLFCTLILCTCLGSISNSGRQRAKEIVCLSNLKKWGAIFEIYTNDNDGRFPRREFNSGRWMDAIEDLYTTTENISLCPMAKKIMNPLMQDGVDFWGSTFVAWGRIAQANAPKDPNRAPGFYGSYGINGYVYVVDDRGLYGKPASRFWGTPNVTDASDIPMFLDCYFWSGLPDHGDTPPLHEGWQNQSDADSMNRFCINRHDGGINCIFLDFAARKVGLRELWTLKWHREFRTDGPWTLASGVQPQHWPEWMREFKEY